MKSLRLSLALLFLFIAMSGFAQDQPSPSSNLRYIEVTGQADLEIVPDQIYIAFTLKEKYEDRVKVTIDEQELKMKEALNSIGIDMKELYVTDLNSDYIRIRWQKKDVMMKKDFTLMVHDANSASKVFQEFEKLQIEDASVSKIYHSKMDSLRQDVNTKAILAAKTKADYLLSALGENTGAPLVINEVETSFPYLADQYNSRSYYSNTRYEFAPVKKEVAELSFRKIKVGARINVKFAIE